MDSADVKRHRLLEDTMEGNQGLDNLMDGLLKSLKDKADGKNTGAQEELFAQYSRYATSFQFHPGDMVQWKDDLRNAKFPEYGKPAVVMECAPGQRSAGHVGGGNHSYEPNDIRIGTLLDGTFEGFWVDSKRFKPYQDS